MSAARDRADVWVPWIEGLLLAAAVLAVLSVSGEAVRASYHGYTHVAIGEAVLREGLRPENPYHAGAPLRYYTLYPWLGVAIGRIGIGPLWAFAWINVLAALLFAPAFDALGRSLALSFRARRAAFWAAVIGFNGLGWIGYLASGLDEAVRTPVYALAPMTFARESFGWDPRLQAFLPKFLNVSSYAIALPFALWALACCGASARDRGVRAVLAAGVCAGVALALNPLVGGVVGVCMAVWLAPLFVRGGNADRSTHGSAASTSHTTNDARARAAWLAAGALAILLAIPFVLPALKPAPTGRELFGNPPLGGSPFTNLVGPLLVLLAPGVLGVRLMRSSARWRWIVAALIAAALVLAGEMPQGNEYKMARLSGLFWALPAGVFCAAAIDRGGTWKLTPWALALVCVPTTLAVPRAYVAWGKAAPRLPLHVERGRLAPDPAVVQPPISPAIWDAERRADPRAVIVLAPFNAGPGADTGLVQGNPLAPALSHALFVDVPQIHNDGQPDLVERLDCANALWAGRGWSARGAGQPFAPDQALERLKTFFPDRPLLVFAHDGALALAQLLASSGARAASRGGGYTLWELPAPQRAGH